MKKIILLLVLVFFGCVSSKEYKARLSEIETLRQDMASVAEKLTSEEELRLKREFELENSKKEISTLKEEISELNNKLSLKEQELSKVSTSNKELSERVKALEADNQTLSRILEAKKDQLSKEIFSLRAKLSESESKLSELERSYEKLKEEVARKDEEISLAHAKALEIEKEKEKAIQEAKRTQESLVKELTQEIQKGEIIITQLKGKLTLTMVEKILFDSGSAEIKKDGKDVLNRVGAILKDVKDKQIRVEGHTDNVPISARLQSKFPTNWELSTARATNVVRYLTESGGVGPERLVAVGHSEWNPVAPNDTSEGRAKNRRIEIVLVPIETDIKE